LVDRDDDRDPRRGGVVDRLGGLRLDAVVRGDHQHHQVGGVGTAGAHGGERLVTRGVDEGDLAVLAVDLGLDLVGADVLGDASGLAALHVGVPDGVQQLGLTVVDVAHDGDHRRPRHQVLLAARVLAVLDVERLEELAVLVLGADDLDVEVQLEPEGLQVLGVDRLRRGDHLAEVHHDRDERRRVGADLLGEVGQGRALRQPDRLAVAARGRDAADGGRLHVLELLTTRPLRLAPACGTPAGTAERALRSAAAASAGTGTEAARTAAGTRAATAAGTTAGTRATAAARTAAPGRGRPRGRHVHRARTRAAGTGRHVARARARTARTRGAGTRARTRAAGTVAAAGTLGARTRARTRTRLGRLAHAAGGRAERVVARTRAAGTAAARRGTGPGTRAGLGRAGPRLRGARGTGSAAAGGRTAGTALTGRGRSRGALRRGRVPLRARRRRDRRTRAGLRGAALAAGAGPGRGRARRGGPRRLRARTLGIGRAAGRTRTRRGGPPWRRPTRSGPFVPLLRGRSIRIREGFCQ